MVNEQGDDINAIGKINKVNDIISFCCLEQNVETGAHRVQRGNSQLKKVCTNMATEC